MLRDEHDVPRARRREEIGPDRRVPTGDRLLALRRERVVGVALAVGLAWWACTGLPSRASEFRYHSVYGVFRNGSGWSNIPPVVGAHAGIEKTPQWMKIPNFASANHGGTGWARSDSRVGS